MPDNPRIMIPWALWDKVDATASHGEMALYHREGEYMIRVDGYELMSSRAHGSEEAMAELACASLRKRAGVRVLLGGLGMGYTLRAVLDLLPVSASILVAELVPAVVEWNRGPLGKLASHPLDDPRVLVQTADVGKLLRSPLARFNAILLDVDNGPAALTSRTNRSLYSNSGISAVRRALTARGVWAVWSASPDTGFEKRLIKAGFMVQVHEVPARGITGEPTHTIFLATAPPD